MVHAESLFLVDDEQTEVNPELVRLARDDRVFQLERLARADEALYRAKSAGRNQVCE